VRLISAVHTLKDIKASKGISYAYQYGMGKE
jgi:hypothetical protein